MTDGNIDRRTWIRGTASAAFLAVSSVWNKGPVGAEERLNEPTTTSDGRTWFGPPVWPSYDKLEALLKAWAVEHRDVLVLEKLGKSTEDRSVYAVTLTDPQANDNQKEHVLITALHGGVERSANTTVMAIIEWLISDDAAVREILRHQVVVCLPVSDPDRYERGEFSPLYGNWNPQGHLQAENIPEAKYVQRVMDQWQPEVHADIHGTSLEFQRYIMFESSCTSYSNTALRPYQRDIVRQMDDAALQGGFPSDKAESDAERIFGGVGLDHIKDRCWMGRPRFYGAMYAYYHFHSLISASEVAWEQSGVLRHRRLLEIGNEKWPGEYYPGYPTRVIMGNSHARITAYGRTAVERRRSRVELWNRFGEFTFGTLDPAVEGKSMCVLATSAAAERDFFTQPELEEVVKHLEGHTKIDAEAIARFVADWPSGQNHPQAWFALERRKELDKQRQKEAGTRSSRPPIEHGLSIRLRLPYGKATLTDLRLNGHGIETSETDGFISWGARGCTFIQVNLPPQRLREEDLFLVTCAYDPGEHRKRWDSWKRIDHRGE